MNEAGTTAAVQDYLGVLANMKGDAPAAPIVRALLERAVGRLRLLCATFLHKSYPRLTQPPLNLQADELLSALAERLLKSLGEVRPQTVREFFALASQHMRWELNDLARRLDRQAPHVELLEGIALAPDSSGSTLSLNAGRMLEAIEQLPDNEREVFSLIRIHGMTHAEVADVLGVSQKTVQRRLNHSLLVLEEMLADLRPRERSLGEAQPQDQPAFSSRTGNAVIEDCEESKS
jgi:RNA polymerase sigma-70 factor (ECF subfamily)